MLHDFVNKKIGLVLAGGGGKGAYQIGCWKALREIGIQFSAVSGTSVGALNAALISEGELEKAEKLWLNLSSDKVFKIKVKSYFSILIRLAIMIALPVYLFRSNRKFVQRTINILQSTALLAIFFALIATPSNPKNDLNITEFIGHFFLFWLILGLAKYGIEGLLHLLWIISERLNPYALDNAPLKQLITDSIDFDKLGSSNITTFATITKPIDTFNLLWPDYDEILAFLGHIRIPCFRKRFLPIYTSLNKKSPTETIDILLRSAALPFGIFPDKMPSEVGWLDGGLADNVPIFPLVEIGCDIIIVIHLQHRGKDGFMTLTDADELHLKLATINLLHNLEQNSERDYELFVRKYGDKVLARRWPFSFQIRRDFNIVSYSLAENYIPAYKKTIPRIVHLIPSKNLGGLFTGTLNFSSQKAETLIKLGYEDTLKKFIDEKANNYF